MGSFGGSGSWGVALLGPVVHGVLPASAGAGVVVVVAALAVVECAAVAACAGAGGEGNGVSRRKVEHANESKT
jgi:hypothetical protein